MCGISGLVNYRDRETLAWITHIQAKWAAFVNSIRPQPGGERKVPAIPFNEIVCSTPATLRIQESAATGKRLAVDVFEFLNSSVQPLQTSKEPVP